MIKNLLINLVSGIFILIIGTIFFSISIVLFKVFSEVQKTVGIFNDLILFISFAIYIVFSLVLAVDLVRLIKSSLVKNDEELSKYSSKENYITIVIKILIFVGIVYVSAIANDFFGKEKVKKIKLDEQKKIERRLLKKETSKQDTSYLNDRYWKCYGEMTNAHKARGFHQSNRETSIRVKETVCKAYAKGEELNYEGKR
tara:strand:+ start:646 stop:1242 length:597 start_codon:yes stop_codon:yes gene_type:complete